MDIRTITQNQLPLDAPSPSYSSKGLRAFWRGFTLAEVLITLTIIGIIAALTIPSLMTKVQDHGFRSAFLKNYALIKNAYAMSIRDGVPFWDPAYPFDDNFDISPTYLADINLLKNYFKIAKGPTRCWNSSCIYKQHGIGFHLFYEDNSFFKNFVDFFIIYFVYCFQKTRPAFLSDSF